MGSINGKQTAEKIIKELAASVELLEENELQDFADRIISAERIFVAGAGRSGFAAKAFTNRIMHLGKKVYFAGDITTPAICRQDLLIISSGSGETESLAAMAAKAKKLGVYIATVTIFPEGRIGKLADCIVKLPGATPKSSLLNTQQTFQPMGNLFEQLSWIVYDSIIMVLMERLNKSEEEMFRLHANLE